MTGSRSRKTLSPSQAYEAEVAAYVQAGGDELVQRVITAVQSLNRKLSQWYAANLADEDLTPGEWSVISHLALAQDEQVTPSRLAEATSVAPSSMTHRLDKMAEAGLVDRTQDESNRTRVIVTLTPKGWEMFRTIIRDSDMIESDVLSSLTGPQREQLVKLMERLIAGLDKIATERDAD